jgi:UDP-N-acetylglucosamine 1-carboxyvinyltransferase
MSKLIVTGGQKLRGDIVVEGSKNAVLPILAAAVLNNGKSIIKNCPRLRDVEIMLDILRKIGCKVEFEGNTVTIDSSTIHSTEVPEDLAVEMRSSIIFLGPILSRFKEVTISYPGGCEMSWAQ